MKLLKLFIAGFLLLLAACTSTPVDTNRKVTLITNANEAEVFLDGKPLGVITGGYKNISVPSEGIHLIRLQRGEDIASYTITEDFDGQPVNINFISLKQKQRINKVESPSNSQINSELETLKMKNEIKQELELERTKERLLKLEVKN